MLQHRLERRRHPALAHPGIRPKHHQHQTHHADYPIHRLQAAGDLLECAGEEIAERAAEAEGNHADAADLHGGFGVVALADPAGDDAPHGEVHHAVAEAGEDGEARGVVEDRHHAGGEAAEDQQEREAVAFAVGEFADEKAGGHTAEARHSPSVAAEGWRQVEFGQPGVEPGGKGDG